MSILPGITNESFASGLEFLDTTSGIVSNTEHDITLEPMHELILEIDQNEAIKLTVTKGNCEIFGTELANNISYNFNGAMKFAVFSYQGAQLTLNGNLSTEHKVSKEPLMNVYLNLHLTLENQRSVVTQLNHSLTVNKMTGPKVLVIGSANSGKSSLSRTLATYAMRLDHQVMLVNLDVQAPLFVLPGALTATPISDSLNVENINYGETETTGSNFYHPKQPLVKNFGLDDANSNQDFYKAVLQNMSHVIFQRLENDIDVCNSGIVVDTPSDLSDELINYIVEIFKINVVIEIDRPTQFVQKDLKLITINKSTNIVEQSDQYMRQIQARCIREYFYGIDKLSLSPYTITVNYSDFKVYKPINKLKDTEIEPNHIEQEFFIPVEINASNINNAIMSIPKQKDKISCHGFVCVLSCDDEKKKCRILLPTPTNSLPNTELILTDFRYYE